ncbi:hypothetical protein [Denitromonas iodatirespirans]|jgi:hypothetical protein|uniref:Uncharacterized protein n=1 Tax=Denitromonas iodatirespirans TaxID=2795389 RepID=A0A944DDC7_DENI1|nr:hypothetical protein [Denitromonas iodatirespirans]MBT0962991.1 hypothetical protein [Denitromonas iodatirespirans]MCZ4307036.1 hypothetical protein [Zoogloeaceae bacterium G21618-S1]TVT73176.1 MAG: hypothetical protein FHP92_14845 [Denitromonas halophila]
MTADSSFSIGSLSAARRHFVDGATYSEMAREAGLSPQRARVVARDVEALFWNRDLGVEGELAEFAVTVQTPRELAIELEYMSRHIASLSPDDRLQVADAISKAIRQLCRLPQNKKCPA